MTKEELEKEAKEYADWFWGASPSMMKALAEVYIKGAEPREKRIAELENENAELKSRIGISVECDKAQKNGELCLGYGGDKDEPCEQCKNCIKCECGYYQLGETEKDEQLTKAKEIIEAMLIYQEGFSHMGELKQEAEQFLKEE